VISEFRKSNIYIYAVLAYMPVMMLSNIVGVKINYFLAFLIAVMAVEKAFLRKSTSILFMFIVFVLVLKVFGVGWYGVKPVIICLFGSLVVYRFVECFKALSAQSKIFVNKIIMTCSLAVFLVLVMQYFGLIPNKVGAMNFVNTAGIDIFGEYSDRERPSAYFYHPYDTALSIMPLIVWLYYRGVGFSGYFFGLSASLVIAFVLGLKVFVLFCFLLFFLKKIEGRVGAFFVVLFYVFLMFSFYFVSLFDYTDQAVSISAGRLYIWGLMTDVYLSGLGWFDFILGSGKDLLFGSYYWDYEDTYTPHNLYLFSFYYMGFVLVVAFLIMLYKLLDYERSIVYVFFILMISLAVTGDLMVFLAFWVFICQAYAVIFFNRVERK